MAAEAPHIDIGDDAALLRLVETMRADGQPRVLRHDGEDVAMLVPVPAPPKRRKGRVRTQADYEAFLSAAGAWKGVDVDKFIADIYESRKSSRPPVEL